MSSELEISTERVQKFIDELEAQKTILSKCTELFTTLTNHFSSLQNSLSQKSQSLDSIFISLSSTSSQTLESLSLRESSIPDRESAATAHIESQKESALAEFRNPKTSTQLSESLKSLSRRMDSTGLIKFIVSKRKESVSLRPEISNALSEAVDPPRLVLEAVDDFVSQKIAKTGGLTDKRWACGMLVQALFPEATWKEKKGKRPEFAKSTGERAGKVVEKWKGQSDGEGEGVGAVEAVMFLQMVVGFELKERFEEAFLRKLVVDFASRRRDMAKLADALGFGDKIGDIIDELIKNGKEIEAVYFATEAGLTERFSPVSLLKSYLRNSKKNATNVLKNGNYTGAAKEESNNMELNSIKAIIKCVEDHKLESEFSVDALRKRATQLEKVRADRKKSSSATGKPQNKRGRNSGSGRSSGPPAFHPAKAAKFSNAYPPFSRRNPAPSAQHSPAARYSGPYNYGGQNVFEGPTPYASAYGVPHTQSPAAVTQQHYSHPVDNMGAYGGQTSYAAYDYGSAAPAAYQPSSYTQ
ncbi:hypothetical protein CRYUN_Cryun33cG0050800 [Craigia yunnanensis]